ncbi:MAG: hypothetical protein ABI467_31355 [Kofleriaceae bacterium]
MVLDDAQRHDLVVAVLVAYEEALVELGRAGIAVIHEPNEPHWFHAQRVVVAAARTRLLGIAPTRAESARDREAATLRYLSSYARRRSRQIGASTRAGKRRRRHLEALALEWDQYAELVRHGLGN